MQIQVTAAVANFLVSEARKNFHEPANLLQEQDMLIYNYCPEYTGKVCHAQQSCVYLAQVCQSSTTVKLNMTRWCAVCCHDMFHCVRKLFVPDGVAVI